MILCIKCKIPTIKVANKDNISLLVILSVSMYSDLYKLVWQTLIIPGRVIKVYLKSLGIVFWVSLFHKHQPKYPKQGSYSKLSSWKPPTSYCSPSSPLPEASRAIVSLEGSMLVGYPRVSLSIHIWMVGWHLEKLRNSVKMMKNVEGSLIR